MADNKQIAFNSTTKVATIQNAGDTAPDGSTILNTFEHDDTTADPLGTDVNHVLWHHVREALYKIKEWDMQIIKIVTS